MHLSDLYKNPNLWINLNDIWHGVALKGGKVLGGGLSLGPQTQQVKGSGVPLDAQPCILPKTL